MKNRNLTLMTDLYELTMMQGYFKNNDHNQTPSSGITRAQTEDMLTMMYQKGDIDRKIYLGTTSNFGADKVLEQIKAQEQELAKAQANAGAAAGQPQLPPMQ